MDYWFLLVVAYGITFGIQNKALFLRGIHPLLDKWVVCTYCVGFHSGWVTWFLWKIKEIADDGLGIIGGSLNEIVILCMASSGFSYFLDTLIRLMESHADPIEVEGEEEE